MTVKAEIYEPLALHHFTLIGLLTPGTDPHTHATGSVPSVVAGLPPLEFEFLAPASSTAMEKPVSQALIQDVIAAVAEQEGLWVAS